MTILIRAINGKYQTTKNIYEPDLRPLTIELPLVDHATDPMSTGTTTYTDALAKFTAATCL